MLISSILYSSIYKNEKKNNRKKCLINIYESDTDFALIYT